MAVLNLRQKSAEIAVSEGPGITVEYASYGMTTHRNTYIIVTTVGFAELGRDSARTSIIAKYAENVPDLGYG